MGRGEAIGKKPNQTWRSVSSKSNDAAKSILDTVNRNEKRQDWNGQNVKVIQHEDTDKDWTNHLSQDKELVVSHGLTSFEQLKDSRVKAKLMPTSFDVSFKLLVSF